MNSTNSSAAVAGASPAQRTASATMGTVIMINDVTAPMCVKMRNTAPTANEHSVATGCMTAHTPIVEAIPLPPRKR